MKKLYSWMGSCVYSPYADYILGFLFYLEAIFFLPTDPMLIFYCIERNDRAIWYATVATVSSVLGGITSYLIGSILWDTMGDQIIHNSIINYVLTPNFFYYLAEQYRQHEWLAILIAGFTPVPYKAATLTAGFCKLSFIPFVICSVIARGSRFYLLAFIIKALGPRIKQSIERYINIVMILMFATIVGTIWFFR